MPRRKITNPLALAVLGCLHERPMHPYEMASTLRSRAKQESIKLNYGSLYSVVDSLRRRGWIVPQETEREGRRPERTVYRLTDTGLAAYIDWLSELLAVPKKEYTQFEAGLSFMPSLPRDEVIQLLRTRCDLLRQEIEQTHSFADAVSNIAVPRLFRIESEYALMLRQAELEWVTELVTQIKDGTLLLSEEQSTHIIEMASFDDSDSVARFREWVKSSVNVSNQSADDERRIDD